MKKLYILCTLNHSEVLNHLYSEYEKACSNEEQADSILSGLEVFVEKVKCVLRDTEVDGVKLFCYPREADVYEEKEMIVASSSSE